MYNHSSLTSPTRYCPLCPPERPTRLRAKQRYCTAHSLWLRQGRGTWTTAHGYGWPERREVAHVHG